jgi:hypothetical protein
MQTPNACDPNYAHGTTVNLSEFRADKSPSIYQALQVQHFRLQALHSVERHFLGRPRYQAPHFQELHYQELRFLESH